MSHRGENENVARAAGIVGMATMLSRIFGFIRDMVVAAFFGAGIATDAFFVAFRIPNLLRRLLGEGSLTVAFIPVFTEYLKTKSRESALELASIALTFLSILLVVVSLAGVLLSPLIVSLMAPGFIKNPAQFDLAVFLTRLMFPYIFFISLVALCMGILNSLRHFAAPALSPVILNISMILSTLLLHRCFQQPITALAIGVMLGGVLQLAMQWPFLIKMGARLKPNFSFRHPGMKRIGRLLIPTLVGSGIYQINIFIGTILASILPKGSVSFLYYADRVVELPLGVFAIAVGTASLPSLSAQVAKGLFDDFKQTISFSLRLILFITVPATVALIALREPIVSVLFQRGAFDAYSTRMTAQALLYYTLGLWAFSVIRVIDSAFFSLQDRRSPLKAAFVSLLVNVGLSILLMFPLKHGGLALATSAASAVNVLMLSFILRKKVGSYLNQRFYASLVKTFLASALMAVSIYLVSLVFPWNIEASFHVRVLFLTYCIAAGILTFFGASFLLKSDEMVSMLSLIRRKLKSSAH
ncbi:putative peptidoglycan lipid II flippase [Syntrophus gentianae]|uniref:Probable lipid II flippase MurJ n=1 Tax=Syntrophus gentianae TaxID=43775 RepID=A0A1H7XW27_9BACT|nr:murein biosynthesis integral membrane protein MurJ [Syntrophus gentianae]SEM37854.1 putative peptidoglycan lipid II flippase [Syntrophus gentianae]